MICRLCWQSYSSLKSQPFRLPASDFKGDHGGIYVVLSTSNLSLAVGIEHATFFTPYSKLWVHGSWVRQAYWTLLTSRGRILHVHLNASHPMFNGSTSPSRTTVDDVYFHFRRNSLTVTTPTWRTTAEVTTAKPHRGHSRINVYIQPLYDVASDPVAPHGLLGQTYDGDGRPLHGKRDRYDVLDDGTLTSERTKAGGYVTTRAKAEGAIEGSSEMYRIRSPFSTNFAYSRFRAREAAARNTSALRRARVSSASNVQG